MAAPSPKDKKTSATPEKEDPKKQEQDEHDAQVEQLRHVFDYFDTDRDHIVDSSTAKRILDLLGFHNPTMPSRGAGVRRRGPATRRRRPRAAPRARSATPRARRSNQITFEMFCATALGLDNNLSAAGKVKRAFHLMKRDNKNRIINHAEFHEFLTMCGMEISPEHSERITELISTHGEDYFTEAELVSYVMSGSPV